MKIETFLFDEETHDIVQRHLKETVNYIAIKKCRNHREIWLDVIPINNKQVIDEDLMNECEYLSDAIIDVDYIIGDNEPAYNFILKRYNLIDLGKLDDSQ